MPDIYLLIDGQQQGPHTEDQVRQSLAAGQIQSDLPAWHEGLKKTKFILRVFSWLLVVGVCSAQTSGGAQNGRLTHDVAVGAAHDIQLKGGQTVQVLSQSASTVVIMVQLSDGSNGVYQVASSAVEVAGKGVASASSATTSPATANSGFNASPPTQPSQNPPLPPSVLLLTDVTPQVLEIQNVPHESIEAEIIPKGTAITPHGIKGDCFVVTIKVRAITSELVDPNWSNTTLNVTVAPHSVQHTQEVTGTGLIPVKETNYSQLVEAQTLSRAQNTSIKVAINTPNADTPTTPIAAEPSNALPSDNADVARLRADAEAGDVKAASKLGEMYLNGKGVDANITEALKWLQIAADKGDAYAQCSMGTMYFIGLGVPLDYNQAFDWYKKSADQGFAIAECQLGNFYSNGQGVTQDYAQALIWYKMAANQGDALSQLSVGSQYEKGEGVTKDISTAIEWYKKAAMAQGEADRIPREAAHANLNRLSQQQTVTSTPTAIAVEPNNAEPSDSAEVARLRADANGGDADAQYKMGMLYLNGEYADFSAGNTTSQTAFNWFKKAADQGNADAEFKLGAIYSNGILGAADYDQALYWYKKAADQGNAMSQQGLGLMYYEGKGVTQDYAQAFQWFKKAADQGDIFSQYKVGHMYANGEGVDKDMDLATEWWKKAAAQGEPCSASALKGLDPNP